MLTAGAVLMGTLLSPTLQAEGLGAMVNLELIDKNTRVKGVEVSENPSLRTFVNFELPNLVNEDKKSGFSAFI